MNFEEVCEQARAAVTELLSQAEFEEGDIFVLGCSTSEVVGKMIGSASSKDAAEAIMRALLPEVKARGLFLAVQCCEHLNRALVLEKKCARQHDLTRVCVVPQPHAGGAMAVCATEQFEDYCMVESLNSRAALGMDIGDTFIGMHLRPVAVPIHTEKKNVGCAHLKMARTRAKLIGGERAVYKK